MRLFFRKFCQTGQHQQVTFTIDPGRGSGRCIPYLLVLNDGLSSNQSNPRQSYVEEEKLKYSLMQALGRGRLHQYVDALNPTQVQRAAGHAEGKKLSTIKQLECKGFTMATCREESTEVTSRDICPLRMQLPLWRAPPGLLITHTMLIFGYLHFCSRTGATPVRGMRRQF